MTFDNNYALYQNKKLHKEIAHLKDRLSNPRLSSLDRSHTLYDLGCAQLNMALIIKEQVYMTHSMENIWSCHQAVECFMDCFKLRHNVLIDHILVSEAWSALVRARDVLIDLEKCSHKEGGAAPAA